jgi:peptide/nickel transport system permease protein
MRWGRYLAARALLAAVTLLLISAITFFMTNVVPADPARIALGKFATPEQLAEYRTQQGLDKPVVTRYVSWLGDAVEARWGRSVLTGRSVGELIGPRIGRTLILSSVAMLIAVPLAFLIGVFTAQRTGRPVDVGISLVALLLNSLPEFVVGLVVLVTLAVWIGVLPVDSSNAVFGSGFAVVKAYVLPVVTLALVMAPYILRMVRANVRDVLGRPLVRSAVLRGLRRRRVLWRHVVPNASLPVVNVVALSLAELVGGVVVIETLFAFPGLGQLLVQSVAGKDIPTVQAIALVVGLGYVILNVVADLVVLALNPRLRTA